jgi:hypothetical protein
MSYQKAFLAHENEQDTRCAGSDAFSGFVKTQRLQDTVLASPEIKFSSACKVGLALFLFIWRVCRVSCPCFLEAPKEGHVRF